MSAHWIDALPATACHEAREWAATQPDYETAWAVCERAYWMLWLVGRLDSSAPYSAERRPLIACTCEVAATARHLMSDPAAACLDLHTRWAAGEEITPDDLRAVRAAAWADGAEARAADGAAWAAARAADGAADGAADRAARAAARAADGAADRAARAADGAAWAAARAADGAAHADIVRRHYPSPPVL